MLNEKKVKLMTRIAIYEKKESKDLEIASKSFKVDYVTLQMLYTAITATLGYIVLTVLYVLGHLEELLVDMAATDFPAFITDVLKNYIICLVMFLVIAFFFYSHKYDRSFVKVKRNYSDLKNLIKLIEK